MSPQFNGINLRSATEQQARLIIGQQCDTHHPGPVQPTHPPAQQPLPVQVRAAGGNVAAAGAAGGSAAGQGERTSPGCQKARKERMRAPEVGVPADGWGPLVVCVAEDRHLPGVVDTPLLEQVLDACLCLPLCCGSCRQVQGETVVLQGSGRETGCPGDSGPWIHMCPSLDTLGEGPRV